VALSAIDRRSLPDRVFEQLTGEVVSGGYPVGSAIPSERELSELLGVNRHVVREAVKRLEQVGLVRGTQGGRTTVLDYRQTAGLDVLALLAEHARELEPLLPLLVAALEMRAGIGADLARLCAERAPSELRAELPAIAEQIRLTGSGEELLALDEAFWRIILDGAGNLAYQLAFNSLIRAVHARVEIGLPWLEEELRRSQHRGQIAAAIAAGDPQAAELAARRALTPPSDLAARLAGGKRRG
jgi:GntR family transcriptional regulator, transcriptional repressor for pyruvate dehydrogenase complex